MTHAHHHHGHNADDLLPWEEYRRRILSTIEPLSPVDFPLREAFGCVLGEEVRATRDIPAFASSAMDGFAVRAEDIGTATQEGAVELVVSGEVEMGRPPDVVVEPGRAVRIPTGGAVPEGADCVVPIEDCRVEDRQVLVLRSLPAGRHVRPAGQDLRSDEILLVAGTRLLGPQLGLLATGGYATVRVHPPARVVVASTGDELIEPGERAEFGQVHDANGLTLFGAVRETGAEPVVGGIVRDDPEALRKLVEMVDADVFVSSGGVSVGERDPVKAAFLEGGDVEFVRLAMQPGMPQAFGRVAGRPFFGLPGNPVSVFVSFELFVRPAILALMGRRDLFRPEVSAVLEAEIEGLPRKTRFARVRVYQADGGFLAAPTGGQQSNLLSTVARANGLAIIPAGTEVVRSGEECRVMLIADVEG
ncbi:MAG TPA: gephyrin-like molybdotransferase Glp [Actinomycetota bacterium]|jgi:molybdopterin molybdotransferase|nr:gephyrin-like molybdotransferase Glp [Actinomycetota bacterium]